MPRGVPSNPTGRVPLPGYRNQEARVVVPYNGLQVGQRLILQEVWNDNTGRGFDPATNQVFEFPFAVVRLTPQMQGGMAYGQYQR